jgi:hypothetical protein
MRVPQQLSDAANKNNAQYILQLFYNWVISLQARMGTTRFRVGKLTARSAAYFGS